MSLHLLRGAVRPTSLSSLPLRSSSSSYCCRGVSSTSAAPAPTSISSMMPPSHHQDRFEERQRETFQTQERDLSNLDDQLTQGLASFTSWISRQRELYPSLTLGEMVEEHARTPLRSGRHYVRMLELCALCQYRPYLMPGGFPADVVDLVMQFVTISERYRAVSGVSLDFCLHFYEQRYPQLLTENISHFIEQAHHLSLDSRLILLRVMAKTHDVANTFIFFYQGQLDGAIIDAYFKERTLAGDKTSVTKFIENTRVFVEDANFQFGKYFIYYMASFSLELGYAEFDLVISRENPEPDCLEAMLQQLLSHEILPRHTQLELWKLQATRAASKIGAAAQTRAYREIFEFLDGTARVACSNLLLDFNYED